VHDLDTTVSGVQFAIALEALVSAAFILIGSKIGDLIGRKRAYVLGLCGYALGALSMVLAQNLTAIVIFWAIIGGLGASLLLPPACCGSRIRSRTVPRKASRWADARALRQVSGWSP
jgi:MFS family permease